MIGTILMNLNKLFILGVMLLPIASFAFVTPSSDPLFNAQSLVPGAILVSSVKIDNETEQNQLAQIGPSNSSDAGGLGQYLTLEIKQGATSLYSDTLAQFFNGSPVELTQVSSGDSATYTLQLIFDQNAPANLMGTSVDFGMCVGFKGGIVACGNDDSAPYAQSSYGGGYSQGSYGSYSQASYSNSYSQASYASNTSGDAASGVGGASTDILRGPIPRVLGEQFSNLPFGAPNTGFGGLFEDSQNSLKVIVLVLVLACIISLTLLRKKMETR